MARKLIRDKEGKRTLMRENALTASAGLLHWCANCKARPQQLYKYWYEPDIGGDDQADKFALPFCSVDCYRHYEDYKDGRPLPKPKLTPQQEGLKASQWADSVKRIHGQRQWRKR